MAEVQNVPVEALQGFEKVVKDFLDRMSPAEIDTWATRQTYIALGEFMTAAAMLGVDTCPLEGFIPAKYDEALGLTDQGYASVVLCAAGYRAADDKSAARPKVRFATEEMVGYID
jgi:nitroreductase